MWGDDLKKDLTARAELRARDPDRAGLLEQGPAVAVGIDAERRDQMEEDGAGDDAERQRGAEHLGRRDDQQDRGDELGRAGADADRV